MKKLIIIVALVAFALNINAKENDEDINNISASLNNPTGVWYSTVWRQIFISNGKAIKARTLFLGADKKVHLVPSSEEDFRKMFFKNGGSQ